MTKVLYLYGGWPGHYPYDVAQWARGIMDDLGFDVEETQDPYRLQADLSGYDLHRRPPLVAGRRGDARRLHEAVGRGPRVLRVGRPPPQGPPGPVGRADGPPGPEVGGAPAGPRGGLSPWRARIASPGAPA